MRALIAAAVLAALLTAAAPAPASDRARELRRYAKARERWAAQHARDYTFRLRLECFCVLRDPVKIRVRGGRPRRTPRALRRLDTVEELFARVREQIDRDPARLDARYSARTGAPKDFSVDPLPDAIDDEYTVRLRRLEITRRG